jgi:hypothetical protein
MHFVQIWTNCKYKKIIRDPSKWPLPMPRHHLYRFQYQKKYGVMFRKFCEKKMFSSKSVTKLEDLTVLAHSTSSSTTHDFYTLSRVLLHTHSLYWYSHDCYSHSIYLHSHGPYCHCHGH